MKNILIIIFFILLTDAVFSGNEPCVSRIGCIGSGGQSDPYYFMTLPSSPPSQLKCKSNSPNSVKFSWDEPLSLGPNITVDNFEYTFAQSSNKSK